METYLLCPLKTQSFQHQARIVCLSCGVKGEPLGELQM